VWSLPKGRLDAHESAEEAAVREVLEETGHRARIVEHLGDIEYEFHWKSNNTHYHKIVTFFLMALVEENAQAPDHEADAVEWVPLQEACDRITHDNERAILLKARLRLRKISP
jgi:8-oxo-dGTP pyrophosphatase MutT (NUDIX family)